MTGSAFMKFSRLSWIAQVQAKAGDVAGAKATIAMLDPDSSQDTARVEIALAQAKAGDLTGATATAQVLHDSFRHAVTLATIATRRAEAGDAAGAKTSSRRSPATGSEHLRSLR